VPCARPVSFATPYPWAWSADHPSVRVATALLIQADADLLRPRDVGQRVLYVDGWPAEPLWQEGDRALVLAPVATANPTVWFGDDALPERIDADHRQRAQVAAKGVPPLVPRAVSAPLDEPAGATRAGLVASLTDWMGKCEVTSGR
jgi:hypothetical protein